MELGPNLVRNPDCILANGQWGTGSLGPDDWIYFHEDLNIASQNSILPANGTYALIVVYESDAAISARLGNAAFQTLPATTGGAFYGVFSVTDGDSLVFRDGNEEATGRILHVEVREVS